MNDFETFVLDLSGRPTIDLTEIHEWFEEHYPEAFTHGASGGCTFAIERETRETPNGRLIYENTKIPSLTVTLPSKLALLFKMRWG